MDSYTKLGHYGDGRIVVYREDPSDEGHLTRHEYLGKLDNSDYARELVKHFNSRGRIWKNNRNFIEELQQRCHKKDLKYDRLRRELRKLKKAKK